MTTLVSSAGGKPKSFIRVLADGDLVIELFINRSGFVEDAETLVVELAQSPGVEVYITDRCLKRLRLDIDDEQLVEDTIKAVKEPLKVIKVDRQILEKARHLTDLDYESAVEQVCAAEQGLDAIITQNRENFVESTLPIWSVKDFVMRARLESLLCTTSGYATLGNQISRRSSESRYLFSNNMSKKKIRKCIRSFSYI